MPEAISAAISSTKSTCVVSVLNPCLFSCIYEPQLMKIVAEERKRSLRPSSVVSGPGYRLLSRRRGFLSVLHSFLHSLLMLSDDLRDLRLLVGVE